MSIADFAYEGKSEMLLIDALIHGFHWAAKYGPTRPVAVNLIEGRLSDVIAFLDRLTCGEASTPGSAEVRDIWVANSQNVRKWTGAGARATASAPTDDDTSTGS